METTQPATERPCRLIGNAGPVHRHVDAFVHVTQRNALTREHLLERERAADREYDQIVAPYFADVGGLLTENAVAIDVVARNVRADVEIAAQRRQIELPGFTDPEQRAGFRIAQAEAHEVLCVGARENGEVGLREVAAITGRGP